MMCNSVEYRTEELLLNWRHLLRLVGSIFFFALAKLKMDNSIIIATKYSGIKVIKL